jgi:hypothetical protein
VVMPVTAADEARASYSVEIQLPNGAAAQAFQQSVLHVDSPELGSLTRNCFSHVADVLLAGAITSFTDGKSYLRWLKNEFGFNPKTGPQ